MRGEDHCGPEHDQHRERNEAMTGDAVISSAADERTEQVTQRAKDEDQTDLLKRTGGVFGEGRQAGTFRRAGESHNDERQIIGRGEHQRLDGFRGLIRHDA